MKRWKSLLAVSAIFVIVGIGCIRQTTNKTTTDTGVINRSAILLDARKQGLIMDTGEIEHMKDSNALVTDAQKMLIPDMAKFAAADVRGWRTAALADVTGGQSYGLARVQATNGTFSLIANLGGLPDTNQDSYYAGWLVKRGDGMQVISTGEVTKINGAFLNVYSTKQDLSAYDFYVVTLQSRSGGTAPEEHLLEGIIR